MERECASRPSELANLMTFGASSSNPLLLSFVTDTLLRKSNTESEEENLAVHLLEEHDLIL